MVVFSSSRGEMQRRRVSVAIVRLPTPSAGAPPRVATPPKPRKTRLCAKRTGKLRRNAFRSRRRSSVLPTATHWSFSLLDYVVAAENDAYAFLPAGNAELFAPRRRLPVPRILISELEAGGWLLRLSADFRDASVEDTELERHFFAICSLERVYAIGCFIDSFLERSWCCDVFLRSLSVGSKKFGGWVFSRFELGSIRDSWVVNAVVDSLFEDSSIR